MESVFQFIFHYTTKHQKIIHFPEIHLKKKTIFQQTNGLNRNPINLEKKLKKKSEKTK